MCLRDISECDCDCHRSPVGMVNHCMPCCSPCPHCGVNIGHGMLEMHLRDCYYYKIEKERIENDSVK